MENNDAYAGSIDTRLRSWAGKALRASRRLWADEKTRSIATWTVCGGLVSFWATGLLTSYTFGGFIHLLILPPLGLLLVNVVKR